DEERADRLRVPVVQMRDELHEAIGGGIEIGLGEGLLGGVCALILRRLLGRVALLGGGALCALLLGALLLCALHLGVGALGVLPAAPGALPRSPTECDGHRRKGAAVPWYGRCRSCGVGRERTRLVRRSPPRPGVCCEH